LLIDQSKHYILKAAHPSPYSANNGFFGCRHFSKTNDLLIAQKKDPINWQLKNI
jgi:uracil-DNA glycosylase